MTTYKESPVALMARSGARGDMDQLVQLGGVRGVLTDMENLPLEMPVYENYREGVSPLGFYLGSHGARRSMCEKKLKTAPAGELTRLFIETAYPMVVKEEDCGTREGVKIFPFPKTDKKPFKGLPSLTRRLLGRVESATGVVIDENLAEEFDKKQAPVIVRSVLTCRAGEKNGPGAVCRKCCGWDLSTRSLPEEGLPIGIIAGQSIGERGTQLTMRTFHTGGVGGGAITTGLERIKALFSCRKVGHQMFSITQKGKTDMEDLVDDWSLLIACSPLKTDEMPSWEENEDKSLNTSSSWTDYLEVHDEQKIMEPLDIIRTIFAYEICVTYKGAVDERHMEVILAAMKRNSGDGGLAFASIYEAPFEREGFLAAASFRRGLNLLVKAALEEKDDRLIGYKERLMTGKLVWES